ncbi:hypothetical protein [Mucilaginibacter glaciei]|uniref:hypothetical protein n=1 Tax=Mucilaginibacter glaciei TaxID=2772109 RepID=UPI001CD182F2|nr:hypothetical protein [Mucilaginibacter glaciei]
MVLRGELKNGLPGLENSNTNGNTPASLNPAWDAQLMGTTLEKIFFGCSETELWNKQQN